MHLRLRFSLHTLNPTHASTPASSILPSGAVPEFQYPVALLGSSISLSELLTFIFSSFLNRKLEWQRKTSSSGSGRLGAVPCL